MKNIVFYRDSDENGLATLDTIDGECTRRIHKILKYQPEDHLWTE